MPRPRPAVLPREVARVRAAAVTRSLRARPAGVLVALVRENVVESRFRSRIVTQEETDA